MIKEIVKSNRNEELTKQLLKIWHTAVISTHTFLTTEDIEKIIPEVQEGIKQITYLYLYYEGDQILGFMGVENQKIEMLFIDNDARGQGIGRKLIEFAITTLKITSVDVNEQNIQGVGFYQHMGFIIKNRTELDSEGRPFPILQLQINNDKENNS